MLSKIEMLSTLHPRMYTILINGGEFMLSRLCSIHISLC